MCYCWTNENPCFLPLLWRNNWGLKPNDYIVTDNRESLSLMRKSIFQIHSSIFLNAVLIQKCLTITTKLKVLKMCPLNESYSIEAHWIWPWFDYSFSIVCPTILPQLSLQVAHKPKKWYQKAKKWYYNGTTSRRMDLKWNDIQ